MSRFFKGHFLLGALVSPEVLKTIFLIFNCFPGKPVTGYVVEKLNKATGRWVPVGKTDDTEMEIKGLQEGEEYEFRVKAVNEEGESEPLKTDASIIAKNPYGK